MLVSAIVILAYIGMIIAIGVMGLKKTHSFTDFFLGGRNVGPWLTAFTYGTAYFSAVLFIGFAGKIGYGFGLSAVWVAIGNTLVGTFLVWLILGKRIKHETEKRGVYTMPEYLESRYGSPFLKFYSAVAIFIFMIPYTAAVFMGLSYLFEANFGMPYWSVLAFMGVFTAIYLVLGGYKSMTMIDLIFGIIMVVGVTVLLASSISKGGGIASIIEQLRAVHPDLAGPVGPPGLWPLLSLVILTSLAPFAMPQLIQKFYAIRDDRSVKIGMFASTFFALLVTGTAYFTGSLTRIFLNPVENPSAFLESGAPNFDALMPELLTSVIPQALSVIILLLILSASMSTLAALVLISSSTIVKDLYGGIAHERADNRRFFVRVLGGGRRASDQRLTILMRIMSGVFVFLSVALALMKPAVIVTILSISWGAIASVFLGPFIWGILTRRAFKAGAIISSVVGLGTCMVLFFYLGGSRASEAGAIGMIVSLVLGLLFVPFGKPQKT